MNRVTLCALCLLVCAALTGCGGGPSNVTGTVTMDGETVASGSITFVKADGTVREGAVIKDGSFRRRCARKYKIELTGQKVVGKKKQKGFDGKDEEMS